MTKAKGNKRTVPLLLLRERENNLEKIKNKTIKFGTDGWRSIIARDFTFEKVQLISQGISDYLKNKKSPKGKNPKVVIGYDTRFLSDLFAKSAGEIFAANEIETVFSETFIPTPVLSNAVVSRSADLGIMITASHNPYMYNGYKIKGPYGGSATMDIINDIEDFVNSGINNGSYLEKVRIISNNNNFAACFKTDNFMADYKKQILGLIDTKLLREIDFDVLIDPMYGAGQGIYFSILKELGLKNIHEIHNVFNPSFGGINPEPIGDNIAEAVNYVKQNKMRVGICVDGDADRIGAIGEDGNFISSHHIFAIVLADLIKNKKTKGRVIKTVTTSSIIDRMAKKNNLELFQTPVGFKYIAEEIMKGDVIMGGEESGGLWINGNIPERDGMLMGLKLLEIMSKENKTLNSILEELYREYGYFVYERNDYEIEISERDELKLMLKLKVPLLIEKEKVKEVIAIDGFKYILEDGSWLMIRPSGTEAVVRVYGESSNEDRLKDLLRIGKKVIEGKN
ncbi:MAG: phosphoglucomutase/phosphomannomutase family protein [Actinobacteria bacterium]|nr:phosphoglucomutase/phosphomannomutase family protein [Actinomycetota bacterium]